MIHHLEIAGYLGFANFEITDCLADG